MNKHLLSPLVWLALALLILIGALQLRLWAGTGGMPEVWRLQQRVAEQTEENRRLEARNLALLADVTDLKQGHEAVEERARSELGMVRSGEVFYQVVATSPAPVDQTADGKSP